MTSLYLIYNNINDTIEVHFENCDQFYDFLSLSIKQSHRTWDSRSSCWAIVPEALEKVIIYANNIFDYIDGTVLPNSYKIIVENAMCGIASSNLIKEDGSDPHKALFLHKGAPDKLVKSAYKILVKKYHPDGDSPNETLFERVKCAYEEITNKKP